MKLIVRCLVEASCWCCCCYCWCCCWCCCCCDSALWSSVCALLTTTARINCRRCCAALRIWERAKGSVAWLPLSLAYRSFYTLPAMPAMPQNSLQLGIFYVSAKNAARWLGKDKELAYVLFQFSVHTPCLQNSIELSSISWSCLL